MKIQEKINLIKKLEKEQIDLTELYILEEIMQDYEKENASEIEKMTKYTYNLWLNGETKASPTCIAYAVVQNWEEIKDNLDDKDIQLDILCEVEEW